MAAIVGPAPTTQMRPTAGPARATEDAHHSRIRRLTKKAQARHCVAIARRDFKEFTHTVVGPPVFVLHASTASATTSGALRRQSSAPRLQAQLPFLIGLPRTLKTRRHRPPHRYDDASESASRMHTHAHTRGVGRDRSIYGVVREVQGLVTLPRLYRRFARRWGKVRFRSYRTSSPFGDTVPFANREAELFAVLAAEER